MGYKKGDHAVFGIFNDRFALEGAVDRLKAAGFRNSDISVLMQNASDTKDFAHEKATKAPEGATTGATSGILGGGILGWLAGAGALAIPGIGPFVAAGPIMGALAGAGIGGAVGGLTGALIGMGLPEYEAKRYESTVKAGGMLLSVHVDDMPWREKAKDILVDCGARDVATVGEASAKSERSLGDRARNLGRSVGLNSAKSSDSTFRREDDISGDRRI
jgi:hypothetical protein